MRRYGRQNANDQLRQAEAGHTTAMANRRAVEEEALRQKNAKKQADYTERLTLQSADTSGQRWTEIKLKQSAADWQAKKEAAAVAQANHGRRRNRWNPNVI